MLWKVLLLTLLSLCCGQVDIDTVDQDTLKLLNDVFGPPPSKATTVGKDTRNKSTLKFLEDVFGPPPSKASTIDKDIDSLACRTAAGVTGKCVPSTSCVSGNAEDNVNYEGKCENSDDICCPFDDVKKKCGWGNVTNDLSENGSTKFGEYPWLVAVLQLVPMDDGTGTALIFMCSGSLIHPKVVMTTAHNVIMLRKLRIRAGEWDTTSTAEIYPYQELDVTRTIVHEAYNTKRFNLHNDIALLLLEKPVNIKPNINTLCLPTDTRPPATATNCFSTGWGKKKFSKTSEYQVIPKKVELPIVSHDDCQKKLRKTRLGPFFRLHRSFICAGGIKSVDTCTGDGGSPLMCPVPGEGGRFMASGMVSWGIGCGDKNPAVYVDVAYFRPWVDAKMTDLGYGTETYTI